MSKRPEHENAPDIYYNETTARKYAQSSRIRRIQRKMSERAMELLQLPQGEPCHILDIGCGSGLSGRVIGRMGHTWTGVDISRSMLALARQREMDSDFDDDDDDDEAPQKKYRGPFGQLPLPGEEEEEEDDDEDGDDEEADGDSLAAASRRRWSEVLEVDMGDGVPFRPGVFDGIISISAIQWLCYINKKGHVPQKRLRCLFQSMYNCLRRGARAVLQFYPESAVQMNMISQAAMKCGFGGGMVVDFPHSARAKKCYLVIYAGQAPHGYMPPRPLDGNPEGLDDVRSDEEEVEDDDDDDDEDDDDDDDENDAVGGKRIRIGGRPHNGGGREQPTKRRRKDNRPATGTKEWVLLKKAERRKFGLKTSDDTKYTMRQRKPRF